MSSTIEIQTECEYIELTQSQKNELYIQDIINKYSQDFIGIISLIQETIELPEEDCKLNKEARREIIRIARILDDLQEKKYSGQAPQPDRTSVNLCDDIFELYLVLKYWNKKNLTQGATEIHSAWAFSKCWNLTADDMETFKLEWNENEFKITEEGYRFYEFENFRNENIQKESRRNQMLQFCDLQFEEQIKDVDTLISINGMKKEDLISFARIFEFELKDDIGV
jgi:hypothetical protein